MRRLDDWLEEYSASHGKLVNRILHWICVPAIVFSLLGLLWAAPFPGDILPRELLNWAVLLVTAAGLYYFLLAPRLAPGILLVAILMLAGVARLDAGPLPLFPLSLVIFITAWAGQFIGHLVEGKRPSFFRDLQFLLIGPLWLLAAAYRGCGIRY